MLARLVDACGPLAFVECAATGPVDRRSAELIEVGLVQVDPGAEQVEVLDTLVKPRRRPPEYVERATGLGPALLEAAPGLSIVRRDLADALRGRTLVAHDPEVARHFLARDVDPGLRGVSWLDSQRLLALTHPDAPDLRLETHVRRQLGRAVGLRAIERALDLARLVAAIAVGAEAHRARYRNAAQALARYQPSSPWRAILDGARPEPMEVARIVTEDEQAGFVPIPASDEVPVPFDEEAIAAVLMDAERGARHFPDYRVRHEQIEIARRFVRALAHGDLLLLEGGTGVGKSLAYLAAAIPFAMQRAEEEGAPEPVVISTRTKLLQDQLLEKDIAAAAAFLGYPGLRAISIKGRANYVCERRLEPVLAEGRDSTLFEEERGAYAQLQVCARTRSHGEVGTLPGTLHRLYPTLRDLVHRSVAVRAEQCTRETCGHTPGCPFGLRRKALASSHLIVANHDLLLRWPPDYPRFAHVITDEGHELAGVADEVFARTVRPEELRERLDDIFGAPAKRGLGPQPLEPSFLPRKIVVPHEKTLHELRRGLFLDLASLGRVVSGRASEYGEFQLPPWAAQILPDAANLAEMAATRLDQLIALAQKLDAEAAALRDDEEDEGPSPVAGSAEVLKESAECLRLAFAADSDEVVAGFERLVSPYDTWTLVIRAVSPAAAFHERFLEKVESLSIVSASLFIGGDPFAALGTLELESYRGLGLTRSEVGSPFPYEQTLRVAALDVQGDLVEETAQALATVARWLGGRTLGLFTSLRRMRDVADRLEQLLAGEGIEVLVPRRASDDPVSLVERFRASRGGAVLLGARRYWQGVDIRGDDLQCVVIEKLPFEVPSELRKRREERLRSQGENPFERAALGHMLLHLKQMSGRLIRSETDRGAVVIVDARSDRPYFGKLQGAFPEGVKLQRVGREALPGLLSEIGLGRPE